MTHYQRSRDNEPHYPILPESAAAAKSSPRSVIFDDLLGAPPPAPHDMLCSVDLKLQRKSINWVSKQKQQKQQQQQTSRSSISSSSKSNRQRFASCHTIHSIPNRASLTATDLRTLWYDKNDYKRMKETDIKPVLRKIAAGHGIGREETARGLEYRTRSGAANRQQHKQAAYRAVLNEQERQLAECSYNPTQLAQKYLEVSRDCLAAAQLTGWRDAQEQLQQQQQQSEDSQQQQQQQQQISESTHAALQVLAGWRRAATRTLRSSPNRVRPVMVVE